MTAPLALERSMAMVHKSKVLNGIAAYIDDEILPKMAGSWKAWVIGSAAGIAISRADSIFTAASNIPAVKALGLIEGENIDIDTIYSELRRQAQKGTATIDLPVIGPITFNLGDVESMYRHIMGV